MALHSSVQPPDILVVLYSYTSMKMWNILVLTTLMLFSMNSTNMAVIAGKRSILVRFIDYSFW